MVQSGESSARERAQQAISRAERRDRAVVTPDNAVSPFDATETTVLALPVRGRPPVPAPHPRPVPVPPRRSPSPHAREDDESPTAPVEVSDPGLVPAAVGGPVAADPEDDPAVTEDLRTAQPGAAGSGRVASPTRPPTAPFAAVAPSEDDEPAPPAAAPAARRSWWRRLVSRRR